jgi:CheY-like chemotaxis protein
MPQDDPQPRSILVVEDDADIREALIGILEDEGYRVDGVGNGREALEHLAAGPRPALILLDLMMPVMNGWQFRAAQKLDPTLADIPVVVISADGNVRQKADSLDAVGVLKKPVELDTLLAVVARYCRDE